MLENILITEELSRRAATRLDGSSRSPNWQAEAEAMQSLARQMADGSESLLQSVVETVRELCQAGSAGISLLETTPDGEEIFRWIVLAGTLAPYVGTTTPRNSPCGVCLERGTPQLFSYPERYFTYLEAANRPIAEELVLPLVADNQVLGTLWIMSHDEQRHFDLEDVRVMTGLAGFATSALLLHQAQSLANFQNAVDEGRPLRQEHRIRGIDGTYRWFLIQAHPVFSSDGHIIQWFGAATDIHEQREVLETLRQSQRFSAIVTQTTIGIAETAAGRFTYVNDRFCEMTGRSREALIGVLVGDITHPDEQERDIQLLDRMYATGESFDVDKRYVRPDGSIVWVLNSVSPLRDANGRIFGGFAAAIDISDRKRVEDELKCHEANLAFLSEIAEDFSRLTTAEEIMQTAGDKLGAFLKFQYCHFVVIDEDRDEIRALYRWKQPGFPELPESVRLSDHLDQGYLELVRARQTVVSNDTSKNLRMKGDENTKVGADAFIAVPFQQNGEWKYLFSVHHVGTHEWRKDEVELVEEVASRLFPRLERARAESALRESERRLSATQNSVGVGIHELDEAGRYLRMNETFTRMCGYTIEDFADRTIFDGIADEDDREAARESYRRLIRGEINNYVEERSYVTKDGHRAWVEVQTTAVRDDEGQFLYAVRAIHDVTQRKNAEEALRESEANLAFLAETSADFAPLLSTEEIMERVGKRLADFLNLSRCNFSVVDEEADRIECIYAWRRDDSMPNLFGAHRISAFLNEEGRRHYAAGKLSVINDTRTNSMLNPTFEMWDELGFGSIVDAPYLKDGRWKFLLTIARAEVGEWREDEVELIRELAERIYIRIERARAEEALRVSEEKYRMLFNSIDEGFAIEELVYDSDGNIEDIIFRKVNQAYERQGGLTNVIGKSIKEVSPNLEQHWKDAYAQVAKTGKPVRLINYAKDLNRWFNAYLTMLAGSNKYVAVVFNDITERKRTEANLAFLAEVSQDFARLTSIDETMDALGAKIGGHFNVSRCAFVEINEAADEAVCEYDWHRTDVPSLVGIYRIGNFFTDEFQQTLRAGEAFVTRDIYADLRVDAKNLAALNIASFITIPIIRDGQLQFVLCIYDFEARDWRDDEIELMRELTTRIWTRLERARAEAALRVSEEKYRTLFNSMDEAYAVVEVIPDEEGRWSDFRFLEVNPAFVKHTGMEYPVGRTATQLLGTPNPQWAEIYGQVSETGEAVRIEMTEDNLNRVFDLNIFRLGSPGSPRIAVLFTDITARKRVEDDRNRAQEAMRAFFSNVSHEFRTPLTLLLSSIQETLSDSTYALSPAQRSQLELAHRNAMRLLKLVNTLLDVSRIEAGRIQAVYEPTDLATLTTELASSFESAIAQAGLQLVIDCPPLPQLVYVDRSMWEKIVLNLLSNAFKFTFAGGITVRLTSASNSVELTVQDTGIGIPAAELPRLFERFYQVKGAKGRSFEGSGIGLSLVQELVKLHGGTIGVSSVEGEGSCFTVSISTGFAHLPSEQIGSPRTGGFSQDASGQLEGSLQNPPLPSTATGASAYVEEALGWLPQEGDTGTGNKDFSSHSSLPLRLSPSPSSARILLVDDNADMRTYLKRLLDERWQVETATNGALALTQIQQNPPDLVLTDVMMPEMDGLQLLQTLRANPQTSSIPIILLSAQAGEEATIEGLETGADDYLIKPFSARELIARVETHLQLALLRQERSANRFKTEFLLTVTHELQSPLSLILGWTRLLQSKSFDADTTAQALATIERSATIETKLIKDLLDISGLLSGKVQLKSQFVELAPLLRSVTTQFRATAEAKQIQLIETLSNVAQRNVVADGDRLKQIIANLLENAIKFTSEGGQVTIRLECVGSEIHITVADTGIGISPDFLPYVFDRFTQAEVPSRHSPGGVGIGLAIARLLVELHHGSIEVASEGEGRGATFTVRLPLVNAELNPNPPTPER